MAKKLRLLIVEDSKTDADLILHELRKQGYELEFERVETAEAMGQALDKQDWDIVISDYVLPAFSGLSVLKLLQEKRPNIPCIISSGRIGDETAVSAMKAGAKDYVMKDNLRRLGQAVERELSDAQIRLERQKAEEALRQNEALMERQARLSNEIMKLFWEVSSKQDYLSEALDLIHDWSRCDCAGIRILNPEDNTIPYAVSRGFTGEFIKRESLLSLNNSDCACIRVVLNRPGPQDFPALTPSGSFYLPHSSDFTGKLSGAGLKRFRDACIESGFQTILIVPIRHQENVLGAIHITDKRASALSPREIEALESIAALIGQGIFRFDIEEKIRASERRLAEAQKIAHLGNWISDLRTKHLYWSDEVYRIFGRTPREFGETYDSFLAFVHPEDRELLQSSVDAALREKKPYSTDFRIILPDGSVRYVHGQGEFIYGNDGKPIRSIGTIQDVNEMKRIEDELRALSRRLVEVQENERRGIARELHDEIGQSLTALKILLAQAGRLPPRDAANSLNEAKSVVTDLMQRVRELSLNLRPSMLDDLGLLPTLLWHFEKFTTQTGIQIKFEHEGLENESIRLASEVNTTAYRIVQEALTNIARHAEVKEAAVNIRFKSDILYLHIEDKRRGFAFTELTANASAGLSGMRERVNLLEGKLFLDAVPGRGTLILVELPIQKWTRLDERDTK